MKTEILGTYAGIKEITFNRQDGSKGTLRLVVLRDYEDFVELELVADKDIQVSATVGKPCKVVAKTSKYNRNLQINALSVVSA